MKENKKRTMTSPLKSTFHDQQLHDDRYKTVSPIKAGKGLPFQSKRRNKIMLISV